MDTSFIPKLENERIILNALNQRDFESISILRSDPIINKFVDRPSAKTPKIALEFINKIQRGYKDKSLLYWAIRLNNSEKMIGSISLWNFSEDKSIAEVGYDLLTKEHGKGIMNEAMACVLEFGFKELNLVKIEAFTHHENLASLKLLDRFGFQIEKDRIDRGNLNNIILSLTKEQIADSP